MTLKARLLAGAVFVACAITGSASSHAQTIGGKTIAGNDIAGTVTGANGPEAGVWVIAETTDLPTKFAKIVVTDDQGRYLLPDMPVANYLIWVRGYGLVDSAKLRAKPGSIVDHAAVVAPDAAAAANYYPALYWFAMLKIPPGKDFGGGSDIPPNVTHGAWLRQMNNVDCIGCHQLGQASTRTIPAQFGSFASGADAWMRRLQSGQAGSAMTDRIAGEFGGVPYKYFGDWTDRIAAGALPTSKPARPQGVERNIVVTSWEWSTPDKYLHDLMSSDERDPTVNAYGPLYGSPEYSTDTMPILDPKTNEVSTFKLPVRDPDMPVSLGPGHAGDVAPTAPSAYWGDAIMWDTRANNHNSMFGHDGRLWLSAAIRAPDNPAFCKAGSTLPSAATFPLKSAERQVGVLDPKSMKYTFVDTCFSSHHLRFGYDADNTLWFSGTGQVAAWLDTRVLDETRDAQKAQGWSPFVLDTNGDGKRGDYGEPGQPLDPARDMRIIPGSGPYAVMPSPKDGSIWYTVGIFGGHPGFLRYDPKTQLSEMFNMPAPGVGIRGGDIDSKGVVWGSESSGHLVSFDRGKCKGPLNGPTATGDHCPEGWSFYRYPGPGFDGETSSAEASYYTWVDQHNTLGLGEDVPISTANLGDGFVAFKDGRMITLRIPYPMGFYAKGLDGRIDDPKAGWKGRGIWSTNGDRTPWLMETGKGSRPRAVHLQVRPSPLDD